jgi:hypothetical protein
MIAKRDAEIAARERALAERERQIAEQRRIMAEEYRLLRRDQAPEYGRRDMVAATTGRSTTPLIARPQARQYAGAQPRARGVSPRQRPRLNFWQRLVRLFAGEPAI